jgi:hypothetical protein
VAGFRGDDGLDAAMSKMSLIKAISRRAGLSSAIKRLLVVSILFDPTHCLQLLTPDGDGGDSDGEEARLPRVVVRRRRRADPAARRAENFDAMFCGDKVV